MDTLPTDPVPNWTTLPGGRTIPLPVEDIPYFAKPGVPTMDPYPTLPPTGATGGGVGIWGVGGGPIGGSLDCTTFGGKVTVLYLGGNTFFTYFGGRVLSWGVGAGPGTGPGTILVPTNGGVGNEVPTTGGFGNEVPTTGGFGNELPYIWGFGKEAVVIGGFGKEDPANWTFGLTEALIIYIK